jgi:hypothetical protein
VSGASVIHARDVEIGKTYESQFGRPVKILERVQIGVWLGQWPARDSSLRVGHVVLKDLIREVRSAPVVIDRKTVAAGVD